MKVASSKMDPTNESTTFENSTELPTDLEIPDDRFTALESLVPIWSKNLLIIFIAVAIIIGVPGNSLVLVILLKIKRKTSTDLFVIFIAICDIISLVFNGSIYIMTFISPLWDSISNPYLCKFHIYIVHFVFLQSAFLITCIGIDRYFKTCRPHSVLFTAKNSFWCCNVMTVFSALFSISHMFTTKLNADGKCILDFSKAGLRLTMYGVLFIFILASSIALCVMYTKIAIQIKHRMRVNPVIASYVRSGLARKNSRTNPSVFSRSNPMNDGLSRGNNIESHAVSDETRFGMSTVSEQVTLKSRSRSRLRYEQTDLTVQVELRSCSHVEAEVKDARIGVNRDNQSTNAAYQNNERQHIRENQLHMNRVSKQVNKTTKIMGAITFVYIVCMVIPTVTVGILTALSGVKKDEVGRVVVFFVLRIYIINNFANPIFYIWLSSAFRKKALEVLNICKK